MSFGPVQPSVAHFSVNFLGLNGGLAHANHLVFVGPPVAFGFTFKPLKNAALGPFNFSALGVNWTNPLTGKMFPVRPLPGVSGGGGGGGHGTVGYGA